MLATIVAGVAAIAYFGAFAWMFWTFPMPGEKFSDPEFDAKCAAHDAFMAEHRRKIGRALAVLKDMP